MVELIVLHLAGICVRNKMLNKRGAETKINLEKRKKEKGRTMCQMGKVN